MDQWITKYAPQTLSQVAGNQAIIQTFQQYIQSSCVPNMMITGPHGCGKNAAIRALVLDYFRPVLSLPESESTWSSLDALVASNCLHIYGSISRGKDVVSEKMDNKKNSERTFVGPNIVTFSRKVSLLPDGMQRLIIVHDFDHMTKEAQMALRRIMELYSKRVRFILIINSLDHVIEAIQSRCALIRFSRLLDSEVSQQLRSIAEAESVPLGPEVLDHICLVSDGDLRRAINYLHVISRALPDGPSEPGRDLRVFYQIFNMPSVQSIREFLTHCLQHRTLEAYRVISSLYADGYHTLDILDVILKVASTLEMPEPTRVEFLKAISRCYYQTEISNSDNNLAALVAEFLQA